MGNSTAERAIPYTPGMLPFILFSLARTGSTTLMKLLNCRQGVRCLFEPFNTGNRADYSNQCDIIRHSHGLPAALQALWSQCNGFKHVFHPDGWPFRDNPDLNRQLLVNSGARIMLVARKNELQRAISVQISEQMQIWTPTTAEEFSRIRSHQFAPLDIGALRGEMSAAARAMAWARGQLSASAVSWMEVSYEDFFTPAEASAELEAPVERLQGLLEFLTVGRETDPVRLARMHELFAPEKTGFQNVQAYARIPNIQEVERELGNDQMGRVFACQRRTGETGEGIGEAQ